ncbi:extracellular solute-binding protein [Salipiger sp. 1_MG-2023]|uniref:ABC transporter substrate-binding protein n=1 Tax=Salipiger sp. 1_MG-2023 TaxID=3062665 RepID=UPI0026E26696|nr:extracellular solute-binding protein [Salipiger sp. 1_MG-2023]MDO6586814.1 extracellular solute-binding protein [Salipiger sp. 1_MG-2023]
MDRIVIFVIWAAFACLGGAAQAITVLTRDGKPIAGPAQMHGASFTAATGTPVQVVRRPFDGLYAEIMLGFVTGRSRADVLIFPAAWLPDFAPYLAQVPEALVSGPLVQGIAPAFRDTLMRWQGAWKAVTLDGDLHMGAYRRDLFEDPAIAAAWHAQTGSALAPPRTWVEYTRLAEFFAARPEVRYGTLEASAQGGQRLWYLFSHVAALVRSPGALFFDPQTMRPAIDSPPWVEALTQYLVAIATGPGDLGSHEVRTRFAAGEAAMAVDWSDIGLYASDPGLSAVAGRTGFFVLPGSDRVWTGASWQRQEPQPVPFLAFGGWIAAVPADAADQEGAWDFIRWMMDPARADADVRDGASGLNPYRKAQLEDLAGWARVMGSAAQGYLDVLGDSLASPHAVPDLRIPGYPAYLAVLDAELDAVLDGRKPPSEALSSAAAAWDQITDRLGRAAQGRNYREAMGLKETAP